MDNKKANIKSNSAKEAEIVHTKRPYDSNPFTLSFNAFVRFFESNSNWAIALIALGIVGFIFQSMSVLIDLFSTEGGSDTVDNSFLPFNNIDTTIIIALIVGVSVVVIFSVLISAVVGTYVRGILAYVALQSEKNKAVSFKEAFDETTQRFWRLFSTTLLAWLKIFGWSLLLIIPGIIASIRFRLLPYVIMSESSEKSGAVSAHSTTKKLVKGRLLEVFGVYFVAGLIPVVSMIVEFAGTAALHNQLAATQDDISQRPKVHWLNLLLLLLLIGLILLAITVAAIVLIFAFGDYKF